MELLKESWFFDPDERAKAPDCLNSIGRMLPVKSLSSPTEDSGLSWTVTPQDAPKRGFLDWLAGDKEKIARAQHATERSLSPDPTGQNLGLTKLMGYMIATASDDWTLLMEVCEQASTEVGAKEAAKALRSEFKSAAPAAKLSAARLWAIMLRNTQAPFVQATSAKKFLEVVEDALNNPDTSPVVRDRLMFALAGASAQFGNKFPNFRSSWRKVKPREAPFEGIPFDPKDPMLQPPSRRGPRPGFDDYLVPQQQQRRPISEIEILPAPPTQFRTALQSAKNRPLPPVPNAQHPVFFQGADVHLYAEEPPQRREREYSNRGGVVALDSPQVATQRDKRPKQRPGMILSPEENIRRMFQECEIAKSNASLLTNSMTYAKPEEIVVGGSDGLIREFYLKCMHSQEIITAQIPWATAQSERARAAFLQQHPEAADNPQAQTVEEELLSEILMAHQELEEAFKMYEENEKLAAQEREIRKVQERSKVGMRLDRTQIQYYAADGSFMTQPAGEGAGGSGSRSRVKPREQPVQGGPFDPQDLVFNAPPGRLPEHGLVKSPEIDQ
ncbi:hypothetical protein FRC00_002796 [Tulasnella sp. 408]|nr:hypothetical protein FRC00_002796 [Tulasnella sp. 408]